MDYVLAGDTLAVAKVDRLERSTVSLLEIMKRLEAVDERLTAPARMPSGKAKQRDQRG